MNLAIIIILSLHVFPPHVFSTHTLKLVTPFELVALGITIEFEREASFELEIVKVCFNRKIPFKKGSFV